MSEDSIYMKRAFELAGLGRGYVSPNPMVGCVIVSDGKIIGEGWHRNYGKGHAEVEAVKDAVERGNEMKLPGATAYVTLEPCSHYGKTPPCADLLIRSEIGRVVIANTDPNPLVAGRGIHKLREAGMEVTSGLMADYGEKLNCRFFTNMRQRRPWVILKWAQSRDGFISGEGVRTKISGDLTDQIVHKWRSQEDAILVGRRTVEIDNPRLDVRHWNGNNPVRVILDRNLSTTGAPYQVYDGSQPTIVVNSIKEELDKALLSRYNTDISSGLRVNFLRTDGEVKLEVLEQIYSLGIGSVLVEGGASVLESFLNAGLWDEIRMIQSDKVILAGGVKAPPASGNLIGKEKIGPDTIYYFSSPK